MSDLTAKSQIKIGDVLRIEGKSEKDFYERITVKNIVSSNGNEEIIINNKSNYYFITDMYLNGKSWAKKIEIIGESK